MFDQKMILQKLNAMSPDSKNFKMNLASKTLISKKNIISFVIFR